MKDRNRGVFITKTGAIAATVGSAVGLGNIWRFPYEAGIHGGGAFMVCYLAFVLMIGLPVLCAEFIMGRGTRSNIFTAYGKLSSSKNWQLLGILGIIASLMILSFYSVVAGWTIEYSLGSLFNNLDFSTAETGHDQFNTLTTGWRPVIWTVIFLICNYFILIGGVTKGIERASNILMPILFLLLLAFCINSFTLPGFVPGMKYLFAPDFSQISPSVLLGALGQAFFSLSLGLGCMMTYASYFSDKNNLGQTALTTSLLDSLVAILAGVIIFPAVFSFGLTPEAGPTLVFEVLPNIFSRISGGMVWSTLFFVLLFLASLTSTVSMSEISITYFCEVLKMSRFKASTISSIIALCGGLLCALSFGPLYDVQIFGKNFFNLFDYVSSNILLPIGGFFCSIFVGWYVNRKFVETQMSIGRKSTLGFTSLLVFFLRWICPFAIFLIFLNSIGII